VELRAVSAEKEPSEDARRAAEPPLREEPAEEDGAYLNGHSWAEDHSRQDRRDAAPQEGYGDVRIDALSLSEYRNAPKRTGVNEGDRPSWFRRTFRRMS
jgi:hypothetical protein